MVATKSDKLKRGEKAKALSELKRAFGREEIIPSSSLSGEGREEIWSALYRLLARHSC
jgi:GTP-binding protein EngB required for normal cell division